MNEKPGLSLAQLLLLNGLDYSRMVSNLDQSKLVTNFVEGIDHPIELLIGVGGHITGAQQLAAGSHCRADHRVDENAALEQRLPHQEGLFVVANEDRDDGRY